MGHPPLHVPMLEDKGWKGTRRPITQGMHGALHCHQPRGDHKPPEREKKCPPRKGKKPAGCWSLHIAARTGSPQKKPKKILPATCPGSIAAPAPRQPPHLPPRGGRPRAWDGDGNYGAGAAGAAQHPTGHGRRFPGLIREEWGWEPWRRRRDKGRNYRPALLLLHGSGNTPTGQVWTCPSPPGAQREHPPHPRVRSCLSS